MLSTDEKKIKQKQYYILNKKLILMKKKQYDSIWYECPCGAKYIMSHRRRHLDSQKCLKFWAENINNI